MSARQGRVRAARLTDLSALGELSRVCQGDRPETRSLGLPVSGPPIGVFSLFRLPLGAFGPQDLLYVYEENGRLAGFLRVERDSQRDQWTIVELDAIGANDAGDIRFRLVQNLIRDSARRGVVRVHVACANRAGNVELFMQAGFARYGEEIILVRPPGLPLPEPWTDEAAAGHGIRPTTALDSLALARLYAAVTPLPVQRLEAYRLPDWERQGTWRIPRSSLAPILRFADVESFIQETPAGSTPAAFLQVGVAKEDQPHYLKVVARPEADTGPLIQFGLGVIAARTAGSPGSPGSPASSGSSGGHQHSHGVIAPVRTYEAPINRRLEEVGFEPVATVSLLMKETLVRVAEPALVPATR